MSFCSPNLCQKFDANLALCRDLYYDYRSQNIYRLEVGTTFLKKISVKTSTGQADYYSIVRSVRTEQGPRHEHLFYLGRLSDVEAERLRNILLAKENPNMALIDVTQIYSSKHYRFLDFWALHWLYRWWGLDDILKGFNYVELLVLNRCTDPESKAGVFRWAAGTACPAFLGVPEDAEVDFTVYRELDKLTKMEGQLKRFIYGKLEERNLLGDRTYVYDITATYFEGTRCIVAEFGHSAGGKRGHKQIKVALAVTRDGYPFYWEVLNGSRKDSKTIPEFLGVLRGEFGIQHCTLVFDRGMGSEVNFCLIEATGYTYLSALRSDSLKALKLEGIEDFAAIGKEDCERLNRQLEGLGDAGIIEEVPEVLKGFSLHREEGVFYKEYRRGKNRYIVVFNPELYLTRSETREERIETAKRLIKEINEEALQAKKNRKKETFIERVNKELRGLEVEGYLLPIVAETLIKHSKPDGTSKEIRTYTVTLEETPAARDGTYDGLYCLITDADEGELSAEKAISVYREKEEIEECFKVIKSYLKVRPVFVSKHIRVRAHVTICMLGYLLTKTIDRQVCGKVKGFKRAEEVIAELAKCTIDRYDFPGLPKPGRNITQPTVAQLEILKQLGLSKILSPKYYRPILESDRYIDREVSAPMEELQKM